MCFIKIPHSLSIAMISISGHRDYEEYVQRACYCDGGDGTSAVRPVELRKGVWH